MIELILLPSHLMPRERCYYQCLVSDAILQLKFILSIELDMDNLFVKIYKNNVENTFYIHTAVHLIRCSFIMK